MLELHCLKRKDAQNYHGKGLSEWSIEGTQACSPQGLAISFVSGKDKGFTFVHPVMAGNKWVRTLKNVGRISE